MRAFLLILLSCLTAHGQGLSFGSVSGSKASSLLNSLVGYWNLNESSGTRFDRSRYGNNLAPSNTPGSAAGKVGNCATFLASSTQYLSIADNTPLGTGDIQFTLTCWVNLTSKTNSMGIINKWGVAGNREFLLFYSSGDDRFEFAVSNDGTAAVIAKANNFGSPSLATWYFIQAYHDSVGNVVGIAVNNGTPNTTAHTTGVRHGTHAFEIGRNEAAIGPTDQPLNGNVDEASMWKRLLSSSETAAIVLGVTFPSFHP